MPTLCTTAARRGVYRIVFFFFNDTATTEIYTLSLHDALPISTTTTPPSSAPASTPSWETTGVRAARTPCRSEEHTSELQSQSNLVCRLLLEKKKIAGDDQRHR